MTCYRDPVSCFFNHFYFCSVQQFICWLITLNSWRLDFYTLLELASLIMWRTLYPCSMALLMFQCKAWDTYQGTLTWQHSNCNICLFWDWWQLKLLLSFFSFPAGVLHQISWNLPFTCTIHGLPKIGREFISSFVSLLYCGSLLGEISLLTF